MNYIKNCFVWTPFLLLLLHVATTAQQPNNTFYSTNISDSYNAAKLDFQNQLFDENDEETERSKRDIRNDIFENELQIAVNYFNSQITSLSKSAVNSIISQANNLNGLQNWLTLSDNNLAINGLNELNRIVTKLPYSIQSCYNSYGFKFSDAINVAKSKAGQCLSNKINEAKSIAQDFQITISNAVADVKDVSQLMVQCQVLAGLYSNVAGLIAKTSCLNSALLSVRSDTVLLPIKAATIVSQAYNSIQTIQSDMNKCGLEIVNTILDQSIEAGKAINSCIYQQNGIAASTTSSSRYYMTWQSILITLPPKLDTLNTNHPWKEAWSTTIIVMILVCLPGKVTEYVQEYITF